MKKEINFFRFARCVRPSFVVAASTTPPYIDVASHVAVVVVAFLCKWLNFKHEILHFTSRCPCRIRNFSSHDEDTRLKRTIHWKHLKSLLYHWQTHWQPNEGSLPPSLSLSHIIIIICCLLVVGIIIIIIVVFIFMKCHFCITFAPIKQTPKSKRRATLLHSERKG